MAREFRAVSINGGPRQPCNCAKCNPVRLSTVPAIPVDRVRALASDPNAPDYVAMLIPKWESFSLQGQNTLLGLIEADIRTAAANPPESPGIVNGLRAARGLAPIGMTPSYRGGEQPTVAARAADEVDAPPDLVSAIQASRRK